METPEEEHERIFGPLCPFCGAYSKRSCELLEETGSCPWEASQPDPDAVNEQRREDREFFARHPEPEDF